MWHKVACCLRLLFAVEGRKAIKCPAVAPDCIQVITYSENERVNSMSNYDFSLIKSVVKGGKLSSKSEDDLFKELIFLVLTRASAADLNIQCVEVQLIIDMLKEAIGIEFSEADIRIASSTSLYQAASLEKHIKKCSKKVSPERRMDVLNALAKLFKSDGTTGVLETDFFNQIGDALDLTPAQLYRL